MKKEKFLMLDFFEIINKLKQTKRTGWIERGVENPESVAEHSFRMAAMAFFLAGKLKCSREKLVKMCLLHDLHESICGDLVLDYSRYDFATKGLSFKEKKRKEFEAFSELKKILGKKNSKEFEKTWKEFDGQKTRDAKIAKELDVLEMLLQAAEYEKNKNFKKPVWEVWIAENKKKIKNPVLKKMLKELEEKMPKQMI